MHFREDIHKLLLNNYITLQRFKSGRPFKCASKFRELGFTGIYIIFHISAPNIDCGYSLEPPRRGGSNEYPQSMFLSRKFSVLVVKFSVYLNRSVFVMCSSHPFLLVPQKGWAS